METRRVQTKREIRAMLEAAGLRPRRRLGQHFLIDGNLMGRLVHCADIRREDLVLEVGPGTGGLTDLLILRAARVVAVERDGKLYTILHDRFQASENLSILHADALDTKTRVAPVVMAALSDARRVAAGRLLLVANLPYQIATPLLVNLLLEPIGFDRFCFTVQREVGARIEAAPGSKAYGPLSVVLQTACTVRRVAAVPASAFWPKPAVDSAMYRIDVADHPFHTPERLCSFVALVRNAFLHRRKTLRYNLAHSLGEAPCRKAEEILDLTRRPETLAPDEWVSLAKHLGPNG